MKLLFIAGIILLGIGLGIPPLAGRFRIWGPIQHGWPGFLDRLATVLVLLLILFQDRLKVPLIYFLICTGSLLIVSSTTLLLQFPLPLTLLSIGGTIITSVIAVMQFRRTH